MASSDVLASVSQKSLREARAKWRNKNQNILKKRCHELVRRALIAGKLIRPEECSECGFNPGRATNGRTKLHGHHDDYSEPLKVRWLCQSCHMRLHGKLKRVGLVVAPLPGTKIVKQEWLCEACGRIGKAELDSRETVMSAVLALSKAHARKSIACDDVNGLNKVRVRYPPICTPAEWQQLIDDTRQRLAGAAPPAPPKGEMK